MSITNNYYIEPFYVKFNTIDIPRMPCIVGREQELVHIQRKLEDGLSNGTIILQGKAKSGKTQLAVAYLMRHWSHYSAVFWLDATTLSTLRLSFMAMAKRICLDHPSWGPLSEIIKNQDTDEAIKETKRWLSVALNYRWLLIYDNYNYSKSYGTIENGRHLNIKYFFPDVRQGHIIITTRSSGRNLGYPIRVEPLMNLNEGLESSLQTRRQQDSDNDLCNKLCGEDVNWLNFLVFIILAFSLLWGVSIGMTAMKPKW